MKKKISPGLFEDVWDVWDVGEDMGGLGWAAAAANKTAAAAAATNEAAAEEAAAEKAAAEKVTTEKAAAKAAIEEAAAMTRFDSNETVSGCWGMFVQIRQLGSSAQGTVSKPFKYLGATSPFRERRQPQIEFPK